MAFLDRGERVLHYQLLKSEASRAPLVIYVHGLLMDNLSSGYFTFAHQLREVAHVLLFDLVGHGHSSFVSSGYHLDNHLEDLDALIEQTVIELDDEMFTKENPRPIVYIGCSFGGVIALAATLKHPPPLGVILLEGHLGSAHFLKQLQQDLSAEDEHADQLIAYHFQHWLHRGSERKRRRLAERARRLIEDSSLLDDLTSSSLLVEQLISPNSLKVPHYFLYGAHSDVFSEAEHLFLKRQKAGAHFDQFFPVKEATHALLWQETALVTQQIRYWINEAWPLHRTSIV